MGIQSIILEFWRFSTSRASISELRQYFCSRFVLKHVSYVYTIYSARFWASATHEIETTGFFHPKHPLHYRSQITDFKYLFRIFDSVMALHRIYREHQVSESLHSFFAVKFVVHTSLKKILEVPKATLDTRKKIQQKFAALFPGASAHLYGARDLSDPWMRTLDDSITFRQYVFLRR